jgi:hypothetical protein
VLKKIRKFAGGRIQVTIICSKVIIGLRREFSLPGASLR